MKKIIKSKLAILFFVVAAILITLFASNIYNQSPSSVSRRAQSFLKYEKTNTTDRICSGEGTSFSCSSAFETATNSKTTIKEKAKYLYLKIAPEGTNIAKVRLNFTPDVKNDEYSFKSILVKGTEQDQTVTTFTSLVNNSENTPITTKYEGFQSFEIANSSINNHITSLEINGLINGSLEVEYLSASNDVIANQIIKTETDEETELFTHESSFSGFVKKTQINNINFTSTQDYSVGRLFQGGSLVENNSDYLEKTTNGINLTGESDWTIELIANTGSFSSGSFDIAGSKNYSVFASTEPLTDPNNYFNNSKHVIKSDSSTYTVDLTTQYFNMLPLLNIKENATKSTEYLLATLWSDLSEELAITTNLGDLVLTPEEGVLVSSDFFYLNVNNFTATQSKELQSSSNYNTHLNKLSSINPSIQSISLSNFQIGNDIKLVNASLTSLTLVNADITNLSSLMQESNNISALTALNLSENNFSGLTTLFSDLSSLSLTKLNLSGTKIEGAGLITFVSNASSSTTNLSTNLDELNLSNNNLASFPIIGSVFGVLKKLNLSGNKLENLSALSQQTTPLTHLDVSKNNFQTFNHNDISSSLKSSLLNINLSGNTDLSFTFLSDVEVSYPELLSLNLSGIKNSPETFNNWNKFSSPKLTTLNLSNIDLSRTRLVSLKAYLKTTNIQSLNLSNVGITSQEIGIILESTAAQLTSLDISNNSKVIKIPDLKFTNISTLNISNTSFEILPTFSINNLIANSLKKITLKDIHSKKSLFTNLSLENTVVSFADNDIKLIDANKEALKNATLYGDQISSYTLAVAKGSFAEKESWFFNTLEKINILDREKLSLEKTVDIKNRVKETSLYEPTIYKEREDQLKFSNINEVRENYGEDIKKEVDKFVDGETLKDKNKNKLIEYFNISFDDYGQKWSNSYLAAVTLAPIMIILFGSINFYFVYHNNKKKTSKEDGRFFKWKRGKKR